MKKLISLILMMGFISLYGQNTADRFTPGSSDQPRDPRADQMNFVPNEALVKFKDDVPLRSGARLRIAGVNNVDKVLKANGVDSLVQLFPGTNGGMLRSASIPRVVKDPQGRDMKIPNLDKIYKLTVPQQRSSGSDPVSIFKLIEELKALPEVEYAEPNYIYSIDDLKPIGPILSAADVKKLQSQQRSEQSTVVPNDPLYSQQWYIPAIKADLVWEQTTGDASQVIGILDTGVDWNHPDLKNKIWTNTDEIPDNGRDDDGNGLVDDIRGWDYINNDNNPMDDNSHGTHVAGIAAAETNNGIGIAGICPKAMIMSIKVFQSTGRADMATIAKGLNYAANNGATVLNMSFGSYARSITMENTLANAYATCVLVAAAGNDNIPIGPKPAVNCEEKNNASPFYPAAFSFVLGVQSPEACFSNYDKDGPEYSEYDNLLNYEMKAPGTNVLSTIPNGGYRIFQGTSMAAPIVSGIVALYRAVRTNELQELMWGNLINSMGTFIDINRAINIVPTPKLMFVSSSFVDTLPSDNNNNLVDAGETIELSFTVRNTWGQSDNVYIGLKLGEFEESTAAQITNNTAFIGSISPYATRSNKSNPFFIHINPNIANNRDITFEGLLWYMGSQDTVRQKVILTASNGTYLSGILDSTMVLTPNYLWIVNNSFRIGTNGKLIIEPGSHLTISDGNYISVKGQVIAKGTPDNLIEITSNYGYGGGFWGNGMKAFVDTLQYCNFTNMANPLKTGFFYVDHCLFDGINKFDNDYNNSQLLSGIKVIRNSVIRNTTTDTWLTFPIATSGMSEMAFNNIENVIGNGYSMGGFDNVTIRNNNFIENKTIAPNFSADPHYKAPFYISSSNPKVQRNNFICNDPIISACGTEDIIKLPGQYWGGKNGAKTQIYDFWNDPGLPQIDLSSSLLQPSDSTHAIVWKVVVNGKDAQDEFDQLDPLGVGMQRFDVYFNRAMDPKFPPTVSMGVRAPFTQTTIAEDETWSAASTVYTVFKNIGLTTGDGINTIRVSGAKDMDHFEIPIEDRRFKVIVSAASSSSLDFQATPGLGKVALEWNSNDLEDGLGYNMYRMEYVNDSTITSPVLINNSLIADTLYTDFDVTPNKRYYYFYKIVRTDLSETDSSKVVSTVPYTAAKGDANGDLSVNVLDVTTIVAYLLNNNPQPFITEAADVNNDNSINVLDIVGVVNLVLNGGLRSANVDANQQASLYIENDTLFADTSEEIGGIQMDISGVSSIEEIQVLKALEGFESGYSQTDSSTLRLLYYSMSGKTIPSGTRIPLLKLKDGSNIHEAIIANKNGVSMPVSLTAPTIGNRNGLNMTVAELGQNYPNPSNGQTILPVQLFENVDEAVIRIFNMIGQEVIVMKLESPTLGRHFLPWNSGENRGMFIYKLEIRKGNQQYICPVKKMIVL